MGLDLQNKLRLALGSVKDSASVGKAMIQERSHFSDIEIAIVRATGHDNNPPDDKYTHEILFLVTNNSPRWLMIPFLAERLSRRLAKTRNHVVALKTLLLIHRLLRSGNRCFEQQLSSAHVSGHLRISIEQFPMNNSNPCFSFLHNYAAYLEERMDWFINQAGKLEMIKETMDQYSKTIHDHVVFRKLPKCQVFLERVLDCESILAVPPDNYQLLAQVAMSNTLKESFQVYMTFCEGVAALLNMLFDLTNKQLMTISLACEILKKASQQSQELCYFYENCKRSSIIGNRNLEYPLVEIIAMDHIMAMKQLLKSSPIFTSSGSSPPILDCLNKKSDKEQTTIKGNDCGRDGKDKNNSIRYINSLSSTSFSSCTLETKISKVWVVFDEDDQPDESLACRL